MAKRAARQSSKSVTRKRRFRLEREQRAERLLIWSVAVVGVVLVGVLGYGFAVERILKGRQPVAVADGIPIRTSEFQAKVRFERLQIRNQLWEMQQTQAEIDPTDPDNEFLLEYLQGSIRELQTQLGPANAAELGRGALEQLVQEQLVRSETERRGIAVASDELQHEIESAFGYDRSQASSALETVPPTDALTMTEVLTDDQVEATVPTPVPMTEEEFHQRYERFVSESLKQLEVSENQFRAWIEASILTQKLKDALGELVPAVADQVELRYLMVDDQAVADDLRARLEGGDDFEALRDELEQDEESTGYGAEVAWLPRDVLAQRLGDQIAQLAFEMEAGAHSSPVLGPGGTNYFVIEVSGHEERELDDSIRQQMVEDEFQSWLETGQALVEYLEYEDRVPTEP